MKNFKQKAVKALIYDKNNNILLQHRDNKKNLQFKNAWSFFGGKVETGESLISALKRELIEELGVIPGLIGKKVFKWFWSGKNPSMNYVYPVFCCKTKSGFQLNEGQNMQWIKQKKLDELYLDPLIKSNLKKIQLFLQK